MQMQQNFNINNFIIFKSIIILFFTRFICCYETFFLKIIPLFFSVVLYVVVFPNKLTIKINNIETIIYVKKSFLNNARLKALPRWGT